MNILLKYIISITALLTLSTFKALPQNSHYFGLDLTKTLTYDALFGGNGLIIEPVYYYSPDSSRNNFKCVAGYSYIKKDNLYKNSNIKTRGYYLKLGYGYSPIKNVLPFLNLLITDYSIENRFELTGSYFGNYSETYIHRDLVAFGIEPNLDFRVRLSEKLSMIISTRLTYVLFNSENHAFPTYYVPGAGVVYIWNKTVGLNIYLLLK